MKETTPTARLCKVAWAVFILALAAAATGCEALESLTPAPVYAPDATAAPLPVVTVSASPSAQEPPTSALPQELFVKVAPVPTALPEYNRREWRHWRDHDDDCQDARQETLIAESAVPVTFETDKQCRVATGLWTGPYTGAVVEDPRKLDIDHMVPLANAHRSGAWKWDRDRKTEYANDLHYDNHLIAATASANRAKGSDGPEDWRPPDETYWCRYAIDWTTIKHDWRLSVTQRELDALREMLATCDRPVSLNPHG